MTEGGDSSRHHSSMWPASSLGEWSYDSLFADDAESNEQSASDTRSDRSRIAETEPLQETEPMPAETEITKVTESDGPSAMAKRSGTHEASPGSTPSEIMILMPLSLREREMLARHPPVHNDHARVDAPCLSTSDRSMMGRAAHRGGASPSVPTEASQSLEDSEKNAGPISFPITPLPSAASPLRRKKMAHVRLNPAKDASASHTPPTSSTAVVEDRRRGGISQTGCATSEKARRHSDTPRSGVGDEALPRHPDDNPHHSIVCSRVATTGVDGIVADGEFISNDQDWLNPKTRPSQLSSSVRKVVEECAMESASRKRSAILAPRPAPVSQPAHAASPSSTVSIQPPTSPPPTRQPVKGWVPISLKGDQRAAELANLFLNRPLPFAAATDGSPRATQPERLATHRRSSSGALSTRSTSSDSTDNSVTVPKLSSNLSSVSDQSDNADDERSHGNPSQVTAMHQHHRPVRGKLLDPTERGSIAPAPSTSSSRPSHRRSTKRSKVALSSPRQPRGDNFFMSSLQRQHAHAYSLETDQKTATAAPPFHKRSENTSTSLENEALFAQSSAMSAVTSSGSNDHLTTETHFVLSPR
jgi:hypothetical protein